MVDRVKLGDICTIVSGNTPKTSNPDFWDGNLDWITPADLTADSYIIYKGKRKITKLGVKSAGLTSLPIGTILLSSRAPIGKVAIAGKEMYCNQGFKSLICSERIYNKYLYWYLKDHVGYLQYLGRGATFKEISKEIIENIKIELPDINQQIQCVNKIEKCANILKLRKKEIAYFNNLVKARFVEMFGDLLNKPKYQGVKLGALGDVLTGGTPSSKHEEYYGGSIPFVTTPCLGKNYISENDTQNYLTKQGIKNSSTHIVPPYSLMVGNRVGVGKASINTCEMCTNQDILSFININTQKYDLLFLKQVVDQYLPYYEREKRGATIKGVPSEVIKDTLVPKVPLEMQKLFSDFVRQIDKSKFGIAEAWHQLGNNFIWKVMKLPEIRKQLA